MESTPELDDVVVWRAAFSGCGIYGCQKHVILRSSTFRYDVGAFQHMCLRVPQFRKLTNTFQPKTQGHKANGSSEIPFLRENGHVCLQNPFSRYDFRALFGKGTFLYLLEK